MVVGCRWLYLFIYKGLAVFILQPIIFIHFYIYNFGCRCFLLLTLLLLMFKRLQPTTIQPTIILKFY
ncbi:MAG: hypothetical protein A3K10_00990 [Bacteroidetes bacterium RIFCSPLOWO2_12_FULL_31_6]|nr:MAG: hypothetical protein A3K10_00990 [Bacteroidetes bacterium RIFCSPLOWO2_12_FULL_31_6]